MDEPTGKPGPDHGVDPQDEIKRQVKIDEAERLLSQAHLARVRGENQRASELLAQAAEKADDVASVQVAIGDDYAARSQWSKALEAYDKARQLDPKDADAERKFGEMVLKTKGMEALFMSDLDLKDNYAGANAAAFINVFMPGVGQIVMGETTRGIIFLVAWVLSWVVIGLTPGGLTNLRSLFGDGGTMFIIVPLLISTLVWIVAFADAKSMAKRHTAKSIERPVPPVDKPF